MDLEEQKLNAQTNIAMSSLNKEKAHVELLSRALDHSKAELIGLETSHQRIERELKETELLLSESKKKQKDLKHARDIQAFLAETEFRRDEKDRLEEEILANLEAQSVLSRKIQALEEELALESRRVEEMSLTVSGENQARTHRILEIEQSKKSLENAFDEDLLATYRRLRDSQKNGQVITRVIDGACESCRITLPPRTVTEVKKKKRIMSCQYCQRWLYIEDAKTS